MGDIVPTEGKMEQSSYSGLFGSREEKFKRIKEMNNQEIFHAYTLSCRSGEIEINLSQEHDFDQFALKAEVVRRLNAVSFFK